MKIYDTNPSECEQQKKNNQIPIKLKYVLQFSQKLHRARKSSCKKIVYLFVSQINFLFVRVENFSLKSIGVEQIFLLLSVNILSSQSRKIQCL